MDDIKKLIRGLLREQFELETRKIEITPFIDDDGDRVLRIEIWLKNNGETIKLGLSYRLIPAVMDMLRENDVPYFPIVIPHLSARQKLSA